MLCEICQDRLYSTLSGKAHYRHLAELGVRLWNAVAFRVCVHFSNGDASRVFAQVPKKIRTFLLGVIAHCVCIFNSRYFRAPNLLRAIFAPLIFLVPPPYVLYPVDL